MPISLQFYSFFTIVLCGSVLGVLSDFLRVFRHRYEPPTWLGALFDLLFWGVVTVTLASGLFLGNWGEFRLYVPVGVGVGIALYYWLASPVVWGAVNTLLAAVEWVLATLVKLVVMLVWRPVVALAQLLWSAALLLWGLLAGAGRFISRMLYGLGLLLITPVRGPYRFCKLHYLLTKRRVKRWLRHKLLPPPRRRR